VIELDVYLRAVERLEDSVQMPWRYVTMVSLSPRVSIQNRVYATNWGERVLILGGEGRLGQATPPACSSTRSR
jgi:hypothetical protein